MVGPYAVKPLKDPGMLDKLLKRLPSANIAIEINNLIAESNSIRDIKVEDVDNIFEKYKTNRLRVPRKDMETLFRYYLWYCLEDKKYSEDEMMDLQHLKQLLGLNDNNIMNIQNELHEKIFKDTVDDVLSDILMTSEEKERLNKVIDELKISDDLVKNIYGTKVQAITQKFLNDAIADGRLSPSEEAEFNELIKSHGIIPQFDEKTKRNLELLKYYWMIENGPLQPIIHDISLVKSEVCYFMQNAKLYERMKDGLTYQDTGRVYVTNKKIIFMGSRKNANIPYSKILALKRFRDGVEINKGTSRNQFIGMDNNVEILELFIRRMISMS